MNSKRSLFLIGFMGSGKTTYGRLLAQALDMPFVDLDEALEQEHGMKVVELFEAWGETRFRREERLMLRSVAGNAPLVVATGGGTACFFDNMDFMNEVGETLYMRTSVRELKSRLIFSKEDRPLLRGKTDAELKQYIAETLEKREVYYLKAQYILDTDNLNAHNLMDSYEAIRAV